MADQEDATFTWSEPDPARPALAVLLRLVALTDHAYDDGDLSPYLMRRRLEGGWSLTLSLSSTLRSSYQFCPVYDADLADQLARDTVSEDGWRRVMALGEPDRGRPPTFSPGTVYGNPDRPPSIVECSEALPQPWSSPRRGVTRGELTRHDLDHGVVHVHRWGPEPPAALAIVFDAKFWLGADIRSTLDNLAQDRCVPTLITVLVESIRGANRHEGLTHSDLFEPFLVDDLLPWLRSRWDIRDAPTVLAGQSLGGLTVSWAALRRPELFGRVVTSSMAAWWPGDGRGGLSGADVLAAYRDSDPVPARFFVEVGSRERELLASAQAFHQVLRQKRYDVRYREYEGGHDIACWRGGLADGLVALLGR